MKKFGHKIDRIVSVDEDSYELRLHFTDGFDGVLSLMHFFDNPKGLAAEVIKGGMFARCFVESGA